MKEVLIDGIKCKFPEKWNELSAKQVLWLSKNFESIIKPSYEFEIRVMLKLMKIGFFRFKLQRKLMYASDEQIVFLSQMAQPFISIDNLNLTRNKFPTIYVRGRLLLGPNDELKNISIAEFSYADKYFANFLKTNEEEWLNKLCATLYRKYKIRSQNEMLDHRELFNSYSIMKRSNLFRKVSISKKIAVLLYYWGTRKLLEQTFQAIFDPELEKKQQKMDLGWLGVMLDLSGDKFGNLNETSMNSVWVIFTYVENELIKSRNKNKNL